MSAFASSTAWINEAPSHWKVAPLGTHFDERSETVSDVEFQPLSVTRNGVVPQLEHVAKTDNNANRKLVRTGDFAINSRSDRRGSAGLSELDGSVSVVYTVLTPRPSIDGRFAHHLLRSTAFQEEFYRWGSGIVEDLWSTRYSAMKRIPLALPPLDEQRAIADYLDQETVQIDALVAKQEEFICLLRERRVAEISNATTKGLRLDSAKFAGGWREGKDTRDYNSNWYRDLPIGWVRARVKSVSRRVTDGAHISPETEDGRFDFVSTRDLKRGEIDFTGALKTSLETYSYMVRTGCQPRRGDVLFSKDGTVGTTAVVTSDHKFVVASSLIIISPIQSVVSSSFLNYALASRPATEQARMFTRGAGLPRISIANLARLELSVPPIDEQMQIVGHLDQQITRIDTLIAKAEEHIALAKERRAALITAAVTGQFDVRTARKAG